MTDAELLRARIRQVLSVPRIVELVDIYFRPDEPFAGTSFDLLGENSRDAFTADDLLAATMLDIRWRPLAVRRLLDNEQVNAMLKAIPAEVALWSAEPDVLQRATGLHLLLQKNFEGVGPVIASKILARKRPCLVPIHDQVVLRALTPPKGRFWEELSNALREAALRDEIEQVRPAGIKSVSLLWVLDVAIWMRHSRSRNAGRARVELGIPEAGPTLI